MLVLDRFDLAWPALVARAAAWRARPALRVLLGRLATRAGYPVPAETLRALDVGLLPRAASRWLTSTRDLPHVLRRDAPERLLRLALIERWPDRVRLVKRYTRLRLS